MLIYLAYVCLIVIFASVNIISNQKIFLNKNLYLFYGISALLMMVFMWSVSQSKIAGDFNKSYYPAGRLILEDPSALYSWQDSIGFVNIPILAIIFTPLSYLDKSIARFVITLLGLLAVGGIFYFLVKLTKTDGYKKLLLLGIISANGPLFYSLKQANSTHFVLLLLILLFFLLEAKREVWMGVVLAIAALIKIPLFLIAVYFGLRGRWRVVAGFSVALVATVALSIVLFGLDLHLTWFEKCVQPFSSKPLVAFNVQSVDSFIGRLLTNGDISRWQPIEIGWDFKIMRYLLISVLVGGATWICWKAKQPTTLAAENLELSIVLCLAVLISPISWTHYYLFLLLPLSLYIGNKLDFPKEQIWVILIAIATILISLPVILVKSDNPALSFLISKVLISHYFFGGLLLLGIFLAARWENAKAANTKLLELD